MSAKSVARRATRTERIIGTADFTVPVRVERDTMYLRSAMGTAKTTIDDIDFEVDASASVTGGAVILGVKRSDRDGWTNYVVTTESLIRAALDHHLSEEVAKVPS